MLEVSFPMANVPRSHLSTAAVSCLSTAHPQFFIFPSKLRDYWNAKLILLRYHSLPFWYDSLLFVCSFSSSFFLFSWSDLFICHSRLQLLSSSRALGHKTGATLKQRKRWGKWFLSVICLPENVLESARVLPEPKNTEKKNLKENVWNGNVRTECWSLSLCNWEELCLWVE